MVNSYLSNIFKWIKYNLEKKDFYVIFYVKLFVIKLKC